MHWLSGSKRAKLAELSWHGFNAKSLSQVMEGEMNAKVTLMAMTSLIFSTLAHLIPVFP